MDQFPVADSITLNSGKSELGDTPYWFKSSYANGLLFGDKRTPIVVGRVTVDRVDVHGEIATHPLR